MDQDEMKSSTVATSVGTPIADPVHAGVGHVFRRTARETSEPSAELEEEAAKLWFQGVMAMKAAQRGLRPFVKHVMGALMKATVHQLQCEGKPWDCSTGHEQYDTGPDQLEVTSITKDGVFTCKQPHGILWKQSREHLPALRVVAPSSEFVKIGFVDGQIISVRHPEKVLHNDVCFGVRFEICEFPSPFKCVLQSNGTSFTVIASSRDPTYSESVAKGPVTLWPVEPQSAEEPLIFRRKNTKAFDLSHTTEVKFRELESGSGLPDNVSPERVYKLTFIKKYSFELNPEYTAIEKSEREPLVLRRCETETLTAQQSFCKCALEHHVLTEPTVKWSSIRANFLSSDASDFAKMFCSGSKRGIDIFETEKNGELLFNIMTYCTAFHWMDIHTAIKNPKELKRVVSGTDALAAEEIVLTVPAEGSLLTKDGAKLSGLQCLSENCSKSRNKLFHNEYLLNRSELEQNCTLYRETLEKVIGMSEMSSFRGSGDELELSVVRAAAHDAISEIEKRLSSQDGVSPQERQEALSLRDQFVEEKKRADEAEQNAESYRKRADKWEETAKWLLNSVNALPFLPSLAQGGCFLHAFLSGGVKALFESMYLAATKAPGLGPHCDGFTWPKNLEIDLKVPDGQNSQKFTNVTTLTGLRLVSDDLISGYARYADALSKSMMYIPVFTLESLERLSQCDSSSTENTESNGFLFQLILARKLHETSKNLPKHHSSSARNLYPCALMRPILILKSSSEIEGAKKELQSSLSTDPMEDLYLCVDRELERLGLQVIKQDPLSPYDLLNYYKEMAVPCHDVDDTAAILLKEISVEIQSLYMEYMAYNFPQSIELVKFLSDASMSRYAPILARHCIRSVQSFSTLDAATGCLASVAKEAAKGSHLSAEVESKLLLDTILAAKNSSLSLPISVQFDNYVDTDASFLTAAFSSSALDIFFSKHFGISLCFLVGVLIGLVAVVRLISSLNQLCDPERGLGHYVADQFGASFCLSMAFLTASTAAKFRSPKLAKYILAFFVVVSLLFRSANAAWYLYRFSQCPSSTQRYISECCFISTFDQDKVEDLVIQKFSISSWLLLQSLNFAMLVLFYLICFFSCLYRQSYVATLFAAAFILPGFVSMAYNMFLGQSFAAVLENNLPWSGCVYYFALKTMQCYGRRISLKVANQDSQLLNNVFPERLRQSAKQDKSFIKSQVLQQHSDIARLFAQHEFINEAFQTWIGSLLERGPRLKEQGVSELFHFPLPKSMAILYDVDALQRAVSIIHVVSNNWSKPKGTFIPGPIKVVNRAIAKIYRAYAGDVRRITDIVRCSVVLDTMEDISNFLTMLKAVGWVEQYEFDDAKQRAKQGQNPLNFGQWPAVDWRQKLQLLIMFAWSYFTLYFLGLPQHTESSTCNDPARCFDGDEGNDDLSESDFQEAVCDDAAAIHASIDCLEAVIAACDEGYKIAGEKFDYDEAEAISNIKQTACDTLKAIPRPRSKGSIQSSLIAMRRNWRQKLDVLERQIRDKRDDVNSKEALLLQREKNAFAEKNISDAKDFKSQRESWRGELKKLQLDLQNEQAASEKLEQQAVRILIHKPNITGRDSMSLNGLMTSIGKRGVAVVGHKHDTEAVNARRGAFQIVRVKNRFAEESPVGGYRDVNIKVRIGFKSSSMLSSPIFVPVEHWDNFGVQTLVCEIQVHLRDLFDVMEENSRVHANYVKSRNLQSM